MGHGFVGIGGLIFYSKTVKILNRLTMKLTKEGAIGCLPKLKVIQEVTMMNRLTGCRETVNTKNTG
jgi:hypothetical protein